MYSLNGAVFMEMKLPLEVKFIPTYFTLGLFLVIDASSQNSVNNYKKNKPAFKHLRARTVSIIFS